MYLSTVSSHEVVKLNEIFERKKNARQILSDFRLQTASYNIDNSQVICTVRGIFFRFSLNKFDTVLLTTVACLDHVFGPSGSASRTSGVRSDKSEIFFQNSQLLSCLSFWSFKN
jgi:hypothetical protein